MSAQSKSSDISGVFSISDIYEPEEKYKLASWAELPTKKPYLSPKSVAVDSQLLTTYLEILQISTTSKIKLSANNSPNGK